jgi:hypothetical protein
MCTANAEVIGEPEVAEPQSQEQLTSLLYFPSMVYTITKKEFLPNSIEVFDEHINHVRKHKPKKKDALIEKLYPVTMTGNLFHDERLKDLCGYIGQTAWNILHAQGFAMKDKITFFTEFWGQEHHRHSAMNEHVHPHGAQIVGFYFLEVPPDSSRIVIHDPRPGKVMAALHEENSGIVSEATNMINFKAEPGMLFFANSWLPHSFTRHGSLKPIKFIHFNISVRTVAPAACPIPPVEII